MALKKRQDRLFLLKLDRDFCNFIENTSQEELEFPWLNSYYRMMIHRSAIYFQLARKVDPLHKRITLSKTEHSAIPILRFCDLVEEEDEADEKEGGQSSTEPSIKAIKVLKRCQLRPGSACEARSADSCSSSISGSSGSSRRAVSMEQREKEYAEARARIFCQDENGCCSAEPPGCLEETVSRIEEGARTRGPVEMDDIHRESVKVMSRQHSGTGTQELLGRRTSTSSTASSSSSGAAMSVRSDSAASSCSSSSSFHSPGSSAGHHLSSSGPRTRSSSSSSGAAVGYDYFGRHHYQDHQRGRQPSLHCDCRCEGSMQLPICPTNIPRHHGGYPTHHYPQTHSQSHHLPHQYQHPVYQHFDPQGHRYSVNSRLDPCYSCQSGESYNNHYSPHFSLGGTNHQNRSYPPATEARNGPQGGYTGQHQSYNYPHHQKQGQYQTRGEVNRRPPGMHQGQGHYYHSGYQHQTPPQQPHHHGSSHVSCPGRPASRYERSSGSHHTHVTAATTYDRQGHVQEPSSSSPPTRCCDFYHASVASEYEIPEERQRVAEGGSDEEEPGLFQVSVRPYPASTGYRPYRQAISVPQQLPRQQQQQQQSHMNQITQQQQRPHNHHYHQQQRSQRPPTSQLQPHPEQDSHEPTTGLKRQQSWRMRVAAMSGRGGEEGLQVVYDVDRRPPKSTELYDPYATTAASSSSRDSK
ncbi:hypothetical protein EDD21DRAFT_368886 [Dissophora ornata]|nr:hypothetical protein EDD21DRAFT_368886 [Dissophora ornata]